MRRPCAIHANHAPGSRGLDDAVRPGDLIPAGAEGRVDGLHLVGVDTELACEAESPSPGGVRTGQPGSSRAVVTPSRAGQLRGPGGEHQHRAGHQHRVVLDRGVDVSCEVEVAERQTTHAGGGREIDGSHDALRGLDQRHDLHVAAQLLMQNGQRSRVVGHRNDDGCQPGQASNSGHILLVVNAFGAIDAHAHPAADGQPLRHCVAGGRLALVWYGVLEVDDDQVRGTRRGLGEALGPVARHEQQASSGHVRAPPIDVRRAAWR